MTITDYVFNLFATALGAVFGWFFELLTSAGALGVYIAIFAMVCVVRFLIAPLIGDAIASGRHDRRVAMSKQRSARKAAKQKKGGS